MRLYDFRCNDCNRVFEELVSAGEEVRCPACSSTRVTQQLSAFAIGRSGSVASSAATERSSGGGCFGGGCAGGMCGI